MAVAVAQPIAGVSVDRETELETAYPSVAAGALGRFVGIVMGLPSSISNTTLRVICQILLGLPMAPLGIAAYGLSKVLGRCYVITNRSIYPRPMIGAQRGPAVRLAEVFTIETRVRPGYAWHRVGDLVLLNKRGETLLTISAIAYPERLRQMILDTRFARMQSDDSLARIHSRHG
ncbi:hypothetical protein [Planctomicrobium piriforme]|uniref:PH domain-containing protein n=1 Tax=Planctomicrobium piriforme TaxID=1576369 RepID=A0A1I3M3Y9_9PLAN|nr:hypothetical protein [Planctomicrobium piriforme]SFI91759.1 hypothetical protein SAMN05421753_113152 [Planctomicrobium piriforme]